jgi:hypothetical protein
VLLNMDLCSYLTYGGVTDCPYGQQRRTFGQFFGTISQYLRKRTHMSDEVNRVFIRIVVSRVDQHSPSTQSDTYGV